MGALEPRLGCLPVEDVPDVVDVGGLAVEVLQVVRMLPHVDAEEGRVAAAYNGLLVSERHDAQLARRDLLHQPAPAAALNAEKRDREGLSELVDATPGCRDGGLQLGAGVDAGRGRRRRCQPFPKQRVVDVPAAVKADCG